MLKVNLRGVKGIISSYTVDTKSENPTTIKVPHQGALNIELIDSATGHAPQMVVTRRVGNNLQLFFSQDDSQHPDIVLEDYYDNENVHLIGLGENGQFYEYVPTSGDVAEYPPALTEGQSGEQVLGGEGYASADPLTASHNNFGWLPFMLLGGAAGGVAIGASGRGSSGHDSSAKSVSVTLDPVADSDNDGRPEFSGTSNSPDSQVVIQLPDGTQITTQTDSEGNWYVEAPTSQPNGTVTVTVTDSAGNSGSLTEEFTDTSSPEAAVINSNDDEQISGKAEPGSTVVISDGSTGETTTVVVDENGDWSIQPNPVNEGDTDVTIVVVDPAGNVSPPSNGSRPDITPPDNINSGIVSDSVTLTDDVGAITGEIASGSVTDDARPTLSGDATADIDHVNIYDNGEFVGSAAVDADGKWSWTPEQDMADGTSHDLTVAAVDAAGNEGPQADGDWSFTVDTSTAAPEITNNTEDELAGNAEPGAVIVITDPVSDSVTSTVADADGHWSIQPNPAGVDAKDVVVEATDEAGNSNSVVIDGPGDSTPPDNQTSGLVIDSITLTDDVGAITGEIASGSVTDDARPTLSGDATADIDHVNIYDNGELVGSAAVEADGKWSWTPEQDMADGTSHDQTVAAVDAAGNEGPQADGDWSFTVDTSTAAPEITNNTEDELAGNAEPGAVIVITDPVSDSVTSTVADADGHWSIQPNPAGVDAKDVVVEATDEAGNSNSVVIDGPADSTPPDNQTSGLVIDSITLTDDVGAITGEIASGSVTDDARPTLSGDATADIDHVNIYDTGGDSVDATHIFDAVLTADGSVYVTWQSDNVDGSGTGIEGIVIDVDAAFYSEYTVNTTTTGAQTVSSVASLPDGGAIVVWQSASGDGSGSCVKGQLLDAKGQPVGAEFTVNTTTAGDQITPQVTVLTNGHIEVVWSTDSGAHIKGQGYTYSYDGAGNVNGLVADGTEFSVNTGTTASKLTEPAITSLEDGGYLVVWQASLNGNWAIYSRQYDANGTPVTAETVLITTSLSVNGVLGFGADWEPLPSVTLLKNGQVAIAYTVKGTGYDAGVSIYDPSLHEVTGSFVANQTLTNNQASPAVSALDNGNYVVTWDSNDTSGPDQNGYSVWGRIYAADGTALTSEFLINTATAGDQHLAKVVSRPDGSFVALFMSATDTAPGAGTSGIYAQYFDAAGNKVGQQMQIHQLTYGEQVEVDATFLAGGQLYVTWTDKGVGDGEGSAIKGRVVDLVETLGLEQMTPDNNDPTTIDYQPATTPASSDTDVLPPNVGLSTNTKETLGGQTEAGATVIVTNAAGTVYSTVADAEGVWSIVPNPLSVGENGTLSAIDAAGNQSQPVLISGAALSAYDLLNESAQVNTTTTGDQLNPSVTRLADGRIVVTWQGDGTSGTEVYMQLYEADGVHKIGTEQQVNQRTANNQDSPQVIALTDGGFLIVYESNVNGLDNSGDGVMARRYGADGQAVTDEFQVNTTYSGAQNRPGAMATADSGYIISWEDQGTGIVQRSYGADNQPVTGEVTVATGKGMGSSGGPEMAAFTDAAHGGMYVTVWNATSGPGDTSGSGVVGQIFAADGTPLGGNFQVNTTTDSSQNYPDVITLNDGSIVVFWDSSDSGTSGSDIRAVHYRVDAATGTLTLVGSGDFIVNSYTSGKQYKPVGVALDDGGYLLIWGSEGGDGDGSAIYAQRFDANDNRVGREFLVNTTTSGNQGTGGDSVDATHIFDAVLTADGSVYVTWQSDNVDGSGTGIEGIVIDVDAAFYSEYTVNTTTTGAQTVSSVASLPDGGAIVVWQSASGDGSGSCVKGQLLDAKGQPVGAEFTVNTTTAGDQITPQVTVLSDGTFQVVWSTDSGAHIKGQGYTYSYDGAGNVNGVVTNGAEYNVDSSTAASKMRVPVITSLEDGGYLVVWEASLNGNWTVYGRQYDANGTPVTAETVLATTTLNANAIIPEWEPLPSVTTLENGQVAITYAIKATGYDVGVSVYDPSTHAVTGSFVANQTLTNNQASSAVSALQNGNYVVTWDSNDTSGPDQNGYSVWGRIYAADGTALTSEFLINTTTAGDQHMARVVSQADGSFIAVFLSTTDIAPGAGTSGIYAQYFDAAGNKVGQQIQINQLTYGEQVEVDATFLAGGQLYVTWTDQGVGDGDGSAIKGRLVDLNETLGLTSETGSTHIEYQPAQYDLNGTSGNDVLDARGANSVDAKEGDDTIVINSTHFSSVKGGEDHDTLVWDSNNDLELGTVSGKISGIEAIHLGNNTAQTLFISASDVLEITKDNGSEANTLHITGDVGSSNNSNATDTVNIGKSEWTASAAQTENGVNYDVYTNNDDTTVKLLIQHGLNVI